MAKCGYVSPAGVVCQVAERRPYSRAKPYYPSVTTLTDLYNGNRKSYRMPWASSQIAAVTAVHSGWGDRATEPCTGTKQQLCEACKYLRSEFDHRWDATANLGNHGHHMGLSWALGEEIETDPVIDPHMDALARFYADCEPQWVELESTVLYDRASISKYRGTLDGIADLVCPVCPPGWGERAVCRWLVDLKFGSYHPHEQTLQLAGYRWATHVTDWSSGEEVIVKRVPPVAHAGVLLLRSDGTYVLQELPVTASAHNMIIGLRHLWSFEREMNAWVKEHPMAVADDALAALV